MNNMALVAALVTHEQDKEIARCRQEILRLEIENRTLRRHNNDMEACCRAMWKHNEEVVDAILHERLADALRRKG